MNKHLYLRAYLAGIALPTMFMLIVLTFFVVARFVYNVPVAIERLLVFPITSSGSTLSASSTDCWEWRD